MASLKELNERIPRRAILGVLMFLACMFSYFTRIDLSMNIVAMAKRKASNGSNSCPAPGGPKENGTKILIDEVYDWDENTQGFILMAYYFGPVFASIPAGLLAERYGGARVVAFATLVPGLLNLLMPVASGWHWGVLLPLRFLIGFTGAAVYPALHAMIARWVPPNEKGLFVWTMQGGPFGTFVTMVLCSTVINNFGWKASFYTTGGLIIGFFLLWIWLAYDTPDLHPGITQREKSYIQEQIGTTVTKKKVPLPLKSLATSVPFIALLWAHFCNMWGIYFIGIYGPKYTMQVLRLPMQSGGALTGLPYIARLFAGTVFAAAGDYLRRRQLLRLISIRKIFMIFSHVIPGLAILIMSFVGCNYVPAIIMMNLALAFNGAACQTSLQNHQDLAPNLAGSLYGIMNVIGSFPGFIIPLIVGALIQDHNDIEHWGYAFWISAVIFFSAPAVFWIFGSASIQSWNYPNENKVTVVNEDEEKKMQDPTKESGPSEDEEENARL